MNDYRATNYHSVLVSGDGDKLRFRKDKRLGDGFSTSARNELPTGSGSVARRRHVRRRRRRHQRQMDARLVLLHRLQDDLCDVIDIGTTNSSILEVKERLNHILTYIVKYVVVDSSLSSIVCISL